jgi:hypothetical protein
MFITKEQLEEKLPVKEFPTYVDSLFEQVQRKEGGIEAIRLRKGLVKNLVEEALPIACFVTQKYGDNSDVFVQLYIGNQNHDAVIDDQRKHPSCVKFLEVTLTTVVGAKDGYEDFLFRYYLNKHGHAGTGNVKNHGSKNRGMDVELVRNAVSQIEVLNHERETIRAAIRRKLKSRNHYPKKSALVISFDDTYAFDRQDNQKNLSGVLAEYSKELSEHNFEIVAVVGINKGLYLEHRSSKEKRCKKPH